MAGEQNHTNMGENQKRDRVTFHYIKSNFFRVIHADGAFGGITPRLDIHMGLYSERNPFPRQVVHPITPEGRLDKEIQEERQTRDGIVREVEVDVIMDLGSAKALVDWLQDRIELIEKTIAEKSSEDEVL